MDSAQQLLFGLKRRFIVKEFFRWMEHCESQIEASDWRIRVI
jgi:hypothetical protein